jgi:predicted deacylase
LGRFLSVVAKPGERVCQRVRVADFSDGSPVTIPVAVLSGRRDGPALYVQAGVHGDEHTGIDMAWRLIQNTDLEALSGTLVVVQADFSIDIHCPLDGSEMVCFSHVGSAEDGDGHFARRERLATAFGAPFMFYRPQHLQLGSSDMTRSLAFQAEQAKRAMIMVELGLSRTISKAASDFGVAGIGRIMQAMGMLPPEGDLPKPGRRFSSIRLLHGNSGGGLRLTAPLGAEVTAGQEIGTIVDAFGAPLERLVSPWDGFVMRRMTYGAVATGAEVVWIGQ